VPPNNYDPQNNLFGLSVGIEEIGVCQVDLSYVIADEAANRSAWERNSTETADPSATSAHVARKAGAARRKDYAESRHLARRSGRPLDG